MVSGGISVSSERPANAWRQRGWQDGDADREKRPPDGPPEARAAYLGGYRSGHRRHESR